VVGPVPAQGFVPVHFENEGGEREEMVAVSLPPGLCLSPVWGSDKVKQQKEEDGQQQQQQQHLESAEHVAQQARAYHLEKKLMQQLQWQYCQMLEREREEQRQ